MVSVSTVEGVVIGTSLFIIVDCCLVGCFSFVVVVENSIPTKSTACLLNAQLVHNRKKWSINLENLDNSRNDKKNPKKDKWTSLKRDENVKYPREKTIRKEERRERRRMKGIAILSRTFPFRLSNKFSLFFL